jgi:hypothetical protein
VPQDFRAIICVGQTPRLDRIELRPGFRILTESDPAKKTFILQLSRLVEVQLVAALELLRIESPEKM